MTFEDSPLGWVQEAHDIAMEIGSNTALDDNLPQLCTAINLLAKAIEAVLTKEEAE